MSNSDDIVIVSGLPRSGTSMMMQMIEAGGIPALTDSVRTADADNPRGYFEFELVKKIQQDSSWLEQARGKVVKMVHLLLPNLPEGYRYRIVLMVRDHRQVLASQTAMLKRQGKIGANLAPEALAKVFDQQLQRVVHSVTQQKNCTVLRVHYAHVIMNPREQADRITNFLGGNLALNAMASVVDSTLYRQRQ